MNQDMLFERIIGAVPSFRAVYDEHLADNGELLGHVLMGDVLRFIGGLFTGQTNLAIGPATVSEAAGILGVLDEAISLGDNIVQNIVAVSFIEHLWFEPYFHQIEPMLGPRLRAELLRLKR